MSYIFLTTLLDIVKELGGSHFFPKRNPSHQITLSFRGDQYEVFDYLKFKVSTDEIECGIILKSELTNGRYVPLKEYVFLLVEYLEDEFYQPISLKPLTARFYFMGEISIKQYPIKN